MSTPESGTSVIDKHAGWTGWVLTALAVTGGITSFLALLGGLLLLVRLWHLGAPVSAALATVPPSQLVTTALTELLSGPLLLALVISGILGAVYGANRAFAWAQGWLRKAQQRALELAVVKRLKTAWQRRRLNLAGGTRSAPEARAVKPSWARRSMRPVARQIGRLASMVNSLTSKRAFPLLLVAGLVVLAYPPNIFGAAVLASSVAPFLLVTSAARRAADRGAVRAGVTFVALIAVISALPSNGRQAVDPVKAETVAVIRPGKPAVRGYLVAIRDESVVLVRCKVLRVVPTPAGARVDRKPNDVTEGRTLGERFGKKRLGPARPSFTCPRKRNAKRAAK
jgi:hypothetical protein